MSGRGNKTINMSHIMSICMPHVLFDECCCLCVNDRRKKIVNMSHIVLSSYDRMIYLTSMSLTFFSHIRKITITTILTTILTTMLTTISKNTDIVEVKTRRQIMFPFSEITTQNKGNKSFFERENREM